MNRVRFRVMLRVCTPHVRYLTFLRVILIKMAWVFAEDVTTSKTMSRERCRLKNPVRVKVRVRVRVKVRVS